MDLNLEPSKDERGATRAAVPRLSIQGGWLRPNALLLFYASAVRRVAGAMSHSSLGVSAKGKGWLALLKCNM